MSPVTDLKNIKDGTTRSQTDMSLFSAENTSETNNTVMIVAVAGIAIVVVAIVASKKK